MDTWIWIVVAVVVVALVGLVTWALMRWRTRSLRERFGPEYERTVAAEHSRWKAESELRDRERRHDELNIRPLSREDAGRYAKTWRDVQAGFVDSPERAVGDADLLIMTVMRDRGYPMDDFERRSADISVDHPEVVEDYRAAHAISMANAQGVASTEDLRRAMVHYRSLFERLLEIERDTGHVEVSR